MVVSGFYTIQSNTANITTLNPPYLEKLQKTPLCINTHIQALTVVFRLCRLIPEKKRYCEMYHNGVKALRRVMECQSGTVFYRLLMFLLMKYKKAMTNLRSMRGRLKEMRLCISFLPRIYWSVRRVFPRIVFPNGFTERDLSLSFVFGFVPHY